MTDEKKIRAIVAKVLALQELTRMTGTRTTRSQGELLQSLNTEEMVLAAQIMKEDGRTYGNHTK
jgi:hypothetical protein